MRLRLWPLAGVAVFVAACLLFSPGILRSTEVPLKQGPPGKQLGPESCAECHKQQYEVWKASKHATSFRTVHQEAIVPDVLAALGTERSMKKDATCMQCHYTTAEGAPGAAAEGAPTQYGVSCEHCHGAASGWIKTHQDFGGPREAETPEHKAARVAAAKAAGMVYPKDMLGLATRCVECHGLTNSKVDPATVAKMVHMGHPMNDKYELVRYLEGSVRHRFYPPQLSVNQEMTPSELARLYVVGQAAKLVSAHRAWAKSSNAAYRELQNKQVEAAKKELSRLADVPEAAELIAKQDVAAARKLVKALESRDVLKDMVDRLPKDKSELR